MAIWDEEVKELIGEEVVKYLLDNVDGGNIDQQTAENFVEVLSQCDRGGDCHCRTYKGKIPQSNKRSQIQI